SDRDRTGFSNLINKMIGKGIFKVLLRKRYRHRLSIQGKPLYYIALVGKKIADIPGEWIV
ncbi:MAG: methyltransferase, partial [Candidatus Mariimomonas ferrooxydans]